MDATRSQEEKIQRTASDVIYAVEPLPEKNGKNESTVGRYQRVIGCHSSSEAEIQRTASDVIYAVEPLPEWIDYKIQASPLSFELLSINGSNKFRTKNK